MALDLAESTELEPGKPGEHGELATIFRPIHYLGSKLRVIPEILAAIDKADPEGGAVLDLFAGSGTVSLALAAERAVLSSDIQEYSRVICSALLSHSLPDLQLIDEFRQAWRASEEQRQVLAKAVAPLITMEREALAAAEVGKPEAICDVLEFGSVLATEQNVAVPGMLHSMSSVLSDATSQLRDVGLFGHADATAVRYFGGAYFSYQQALDLDSIAVTLKYLAPARRDVFMAVLLSTASDVVNTVGKQFAQPIRPRSKDGAPKRHLISKIIRDRAVQVPEVFDRWLARYAQVRSGRHPCLAAKCDYAAAFDLFRGKFSVVYADPPYTRDHYSRYYHVLETLALRDNPKIALSPGAVQGELSRGLYREERHQSPFCIKTKVRPAFAELFSKCAEQGASLVLSYSPFEKDSNARPRLMSVDEIAELARRHFAVVEVEAVGGLTHSKLNSSLLNYGMPPEAEVAFVCTQPFC